MQDRKWPTNLVCHAVTNSNSLAGLAARIRSLHQVRLPHRKRQRQRVRVKVGLAVVTTTHLPQPPQQQRGMPTTVQLRWQCKRRHRDLTLVIEAFRIYNYKSKPRSCLRAQPQGRPQQDSPIDLATPMLQHLFRSHIPVFL